MAGRRRAPLQEWPRPGAREGSRQGPLPVKTIEWVGGVDGHAALIDQTLLPAEERILEVRTVEWMAAAIRSLSVRGAPAIGIAAAYGVVLGVREAVRWSPARFLKTLEKTADHLAASRPTAVNLFWALDRMRRKGRALIEGGISPAGAAELLLDEAKAIHREDAAMCEAIGRHGAALIRDGATVLTHCNAGALATGGMGTALAPIYVAAAMGKRVAVFADETRPLLQGARLTAWELSRAGIDVTLICDNMAARVMGEGKVDCAIVGADRIARNGDTANKIGTYGVATLARAHGIPFYVAAPSTTFDLSIADGSRIPIEERDPDEVRAGFGRRTAPGRVKVYNPAFDVTPAKLIAAFITEKGIMRPPYGRTIARAIG